HTRVRLYLLLLPPYPTHRALHSFPTRRSSDLNRAGAWPSRRRPPRACRHRGVVSWWLAENPSACGCRPSPAGARSPRRCPTGPRSEEHTSELQSPCNLVCRLLLEKKKKKKTITDYWLTSFATYQPTPI